MSSSPHVLTFRSPASPSRTTQAANQSHQPSDMLLGPSPVMAHLWQQVRRVAPYYRTALLMGERGSGVEAVAQALHFFSPLREHSFTVLTPSDAEIRFANGNTRLTTGTYFFPDVDCLSPGLQQALFRVMKTRKPNQVCVIAGSGMDLRPLVSTGGFSQGLANALTQLQLNVPALRERREDIPSLANHFIDVEGRIRGEARSFSNVFFDTLATLDWPGNLPQLQHALRLVMERFAIGSEPSAEDLEQLLIHTQPKREKQVEPMPLLKLDQVIHEHIRTVLLRCNGNKLKAAEVLGISRSTLYRMLDARAASGRLPIAS